MRRITVARCLSGRAQDRAAHARGSLGAQDAFRRAFVRVIDEPEAIDVPHRRHFHGEPVQAGVDGDAIEPRADRRLALEPREAAPRAKESILRQVAGIGVIADEPVADLIDRSLVPSHEQVEGIASAFPARRHQRPIVEAVEWCGHVGRRRRADHPHPPLRHVAAGPAPNPPVPNSQAPPFRTRAAEAPPLLTLDRTPRQKVEKTTPDTSGAELQFCSSPTEAAYRRRNWSTSAGARQSVTCAERAALEGRHGRGVGQDVLGSASAPARR